MPTFAKLVKYCATGIVNTGLTYIVYAVLIGIHLTSSMALAIGYVCGMVSSYLVNAKWTFQSTSWSRGEFARFLFVNLIILGVSEVTLQWILTHLVTSRYVGQALNLIPIVLLGFVANQRFVFTKNLPMSPEREAERQATARLFPIAIGLVFIQRIVLGASALYFTKLHHYWKSTPWRVLVQGYVHWDSGWYVKIAQGGYVHLKQTAFWPLYPWVMRTVHDITGLPVQACGVIVSLVCFVAAVFFLGMLTYRNFGLGVAYTAMVLFTFYPTSYYFDAVYTEALFMALTIATVYFAHTRRFLAANIYAAFSVLTRNTGILICLVICAEYLEATRPGWKFWTIGWWRKLGWPVTFMCIPPLTLFAYCLSLQHRFGYFFAFMKAEKFWHRTYMPPWQTFSRALEQFLKPGTTIMQHTYVMFEVASFAFAVAILCLGLRFTGRSIAGWGLWTYSALVLWIASTEPSVNIPDYLVSLPRYVLMLFPLFIYMARALCTKNVNRLRFGTIVLVCLFASCLFWKSGLFYIDRWIA